MITGILIHVFVIQNIVLGNWQCPTIAREIDIFRERIQVVIGPNQRLLQTFHIEEYMALEQELFAAFLEQVVERYRSVSLGILGLIGFLLRDKIFDKIVKIYKSEKYSTLAAFKKGD